MSRGQRTVPVVVGLVLGAVFVGGMVFAARRGDPADLLARWIRHLSLTPLLGAAVGALLGGGLGALVAWFNQQHAEGLVEYSRQMNFTFQPEMPADEVTRLKRLFPELDFLSPCNWMVGKHDGVDLGMVDCTVFERNGLAPAGTHVRKTLVLALQALPGKPSVQIQPRVPWVRWPFTYVVLGFRALAAALSSGGIERQFRRHYDVWWLGRRADAQVLDRLLGADGVAYLAAHRGWTVLVHEGHLAAWQPGLAESSAHERPGQVEQVVNMFRLLSRAAEAHPKS